MISICIPIFNTDISLLVEVLSQQSASLDNSIEIILLDDASKDRNIAKQNKIRSEYFENVHYFENQQNIGLASTRNKLASLAKNPYLLFIDSDAQVSNNNFIQTYYNSLCPETVIFGGCMYVKERPSDSNILRWKYGKQREEGTGKYFSCFNFLIPRKILFLYPFNERLKNYGYEDLLFGLTLEYNNIKIKHLNNPLIHNGLDSANTYLMKVKQSIENLVEIEPELKRIQKQNSVKILRAYNFVRKIKCYKLFIYTSSLLNNCILLNLTSKRPSLMLLDFYKLSYLCKLKIGK